MVEKREAVSPAAVAKICFFFSFTRSVTHYECDVMCDLRSSFSKMKKTKRRKTQAHTHTCQGKKQEMKFTLNYEYNNQLVARAIHESSSYRLNHLDNGVFVYCRWFGKHCALVILCRLCLCHRTFNWTNAWASKMKTKKETQSPKRM